VDQKQVCKAYITLIGKKLVAALRLLVGLYHQIYFTNYFNNMKDEFKVKDSGERLDFKSGMRRDVNTGKIRYDLIPLFMLKRWAVHMTKGAEKYGENNWQLANSGEEYGRFKESAFRHFMQWYEGDVDEDHAAATFFNITASEYLKSRLNRKEVV
jgi:hypothetical protein